MGKMAASDYLLASLSFRRLFSERFYECDPVGLTEVWRSLGLGSVLGDRAWAHSVCAYETDPLQTALSRLNEEFYRSKTIPDANNRGVVRLADGVYRLDAELDLGPYPWFDLIGTSRDGTVITYSGDDLKATVYANQTQSMIANLTIVRGGSFDPPANGRGVRYALHDNGGPNTPVARNPIFANLRCLTCKSVGSNGVGAGFASGSTHAYINVQSDYGFFCHNGDDVRQAWEERVPRRAPGGPGKIMFLDCEAGRTNGIEPPPVGLLYWNMGSGLADQLIVSGGAFSGYEHGLHVMNFGPPFPGESETEVVLHNSPAFQRVVDDSLIVDGTKVTT